MAKPNFIELGNGEQIPILYEDRSVIAIDKPPGWMLVPFSWQKTNRNLQAALVSSVASGSFWARSRNLKFIRYIHRLDAETSGILLFARSQGALDTYSHLFESRKMQKVYLVVVQGVPKQTEWTCRLKLAPDPKQIGRMIVDVNEGKDSETHFRVLQTREQTSLLEAKPVTGRTHQIRVHAAQTGHSVVGDEMYGSPSSTSRFPMGLRAVYLSYSDPFNKRVIHIRAPAEDFLREFKFKPAAAFGAPPAAGDRPSSI